MIDAVSALVHYSHTHDAEHWQRLPVRVSTIQVRIAQGRPGYLYH